MKKKKTEGSEKKSGECNERRNSVGPAKNGKGSGRKKVGKKRLAKPGPKDDRGRNVY